MAGLHTWAGVVIGSLLFAIFWMGTLSVFDREIDRWMNPGSRLSPALASQAISTPEFQLTSETNVVRQTNFLSIASSLSD